MAPLGDGPGIWKRGRHRCRDAFRSSPQPNRRIDQLIWMLRSRQEGTPASRSHTLWPARYHRERRAPQCDVWGARCFGTLDGIGRDCRIFLWAVVVSMQCGKGLSQCDAMLPCRKLGREEVALMAKMGFRPTGDMKAVRLGTGQLGGNTTSLCLSVLTRPAACVHVCSRTKKQERVQSNVTVDARHLFLATWPGKTRLQLCTVHK